MTSLSVTYLNLLVDPSHREPCELLEAWFTLPDVAEAVAATGARVTVIQAAHRDGSLERRGVRYRFVRTPDPSRIGRRLGLWTTPIGDGLTNVLRETSPDVVHLHGLGFPRHARRIRRGLPGTPMLIQDHADRPPRAWLRPLFRWGLSGVEGVSFTAPEQAEPFRAAGLLHDDTRLFTLPESSSRFMPGDAAQARRKTGLYGSPAFLWLGHLDANKDPLTVLDALSSVVDDMEDPQLWCAFLTAPLRNEVESRIAADRRLAGRVHLIGPQPRARVQALLRAADFLVQASHREGSGYAVIEALASGTAPIVTDIPSFRALTGGGAVGFLVPVGDATAMGRAMRRAAGSDARLLGGEARRHFESHLSFEAVGRTLVDAYRSLLS